jgi:hypothetical protein
MKTIAASIIVLAGAILMASGAHVKTDTQNFMMMAGGVVGLVGLAAWYKSFFDEKP